MLQPKAGSGAPVAVYAVELSAPGSGPPRRFLVDSWVPQATLGAASGPPEASTGTQTEAASELNYDQGRLGAVWLLVPAGIGLLLVGVLGGFGVRSVMRARRASAIPRAVTPLVERAELGGGVDVGEERRVELEHCDVELGERGAERELARAGAGARGRGARSGGRRRGAAPSAGRPRRGTRRRASAGARASRAGSRPAARRRARCGPGGGRRRAPRSARGSRFRRRGARTGARGRPRACRARAARRTSRAPARHARRASHRRAGQAPSASRSACSRRPRAGAP